MKTVPKDASPEGQGTREATPPIPTTMIVDDPGIDPDEPSPDRGGFGMVVLGILVLGAVIAGAIGVGGLVVGWW